MAEKKNPLFGYLREEGSTKIYTATSEWKTISTFWRIKMYPVHPVSGEPLEQKSVGKDTEELLPASWKSVTRALLG